MSFSLMICLNSISTVRHRAESGTIVHTALEWILGAVAHLLHHKEDPGDHGRQRNERKREFIGQDQREFLAGSRGLENIEKRQRQQQNKYPRKNGAETRNLPRERRVLDALACLLTVSQSA
jgi:hypothetical protein